MDSMTALTKLSSRWREDPVLRSSQAHWRRIAVLFGSVERCYEAAARFDAYRDRKTSGQGSEGGKPLQLKALHRQIAYLEGIIDRELDRLTVERLRLDLARKQAEAAA